MLAKELAILPDLEVVRVRVDEDGVRVKAGRFETKIPTRAPPNVTELQEQNYLLGDFRMIATKLKPLPVDIITVAFASGAPLKLSLSMGLEELDIYFAPCMVVRRSQE